MLFEHYEQITASGDSVSLFHRFGDHVDQVWIKRRRTASHREGSTTDELFGARLADSPRNPVLGADPANCTAQLGAPGPWSERWPHFRSGFMPSSGEEIQSEFFVARDDATAAIAAIAPLAASIQPLLLVCELRTVAQDSLWLSPQYRRRSTGIHFTWRRRQPEVAAPGGRDRGPARAVCPSPPLGQGIHRPRRRARPALRAPERLRRPARRVGSSRSVHQRLASLPGPRAGSGILKPRLPY